MTLKRDVNPVLTLIKRFLQENGPQPLEAICEEIHISRRWTLEYMKILRANKEVYLAPYGKRKSNAPLMRYALGDEPDAIKPKPKRPRDSKAKSYAKHREEINIKRRAARAEAKGVHPKTLHYMTILGAI